MKNIVIGTAGHIDHGKTSIVKALTGINPTRHKEEIQRNITIDLGFSYLKIDNHPVSIIDLPGHEKFISNMIVGSSNIDMFLFVIAADDGIMPQTVEHFEIMSLLKIKHAIIIINKIDLVTSEILEERTKEIRSFFSKTSFKDSPIISATIYNETSLKNLQEQIVDYIKNAYFVNKDYDIFRIAIDRSFTMNGLGTIITGTTQGKTLHINDLLQVYPSNEIIKVRNIQNHNVNVDVINTGQRAALQISKLSHKDIKRGHVLASVNSLLIGNYIDVKIDMLESAKPLKNNQLIRVFHQTKEYIGRLKLFNNVVDSENNIFGTIFLQEPIYGLVNDLALLRRFSPIKTTGGIQILAIYNTKPLLDSKYYLKYNKNDIKTQILNHFVTNTLLDNKQIHAISPYYDKVSMECNLLVNKNIITKLESDNDLFMLSSTYNSIVNNSINILNEYHVNNPLSRGLNSLDLYQVTNYKITFKLFKQIINSNNNIIITDNYCLLNGFKIILSDSHKQRTNTIITFIKHHDYNLCNFNTLYEKFYTNEDKLLLTNLIDSNTVYIINKEYLILDRMYNNLIQILNDMSTNNERITIANFKARINVSRKYSLMLLEHFDSIDITLRVDDYRIIKKKI